MELPTVPPSVTVNTGDEEYPNQIKEDFFASILSFLGYDDHSSAHFTDREDRVLSIYDQISPIHTDDRITILTARHILVASVIYWRDSANYVCVVYAHYLNERVIERARWHPPSE